MARSAFPDLPVIIGGLEASLRRFVHYDYWADTVFASELERADADLLVYGMGETAIGQAAQRLSQNQDLKGIPGTCRWVESPEELPTETLMLPSFSECAKDKRKYRKAAILAYQEHDPIRGKRLAQKQSQKMLLCEAPAMPLTRAELDAVADYAYTRLADPSYTQPIPGLEEVRYSVIHNRGCFGACRFCSLAYHQGRLISSRSHASVIREVKGFLKDPDFKGYVSDVGGPTANFRQNSCPDAGKRGVCRNRECLGSHPCPNLKADQSDFLQLLRQLRPPTGDFPANQRVVRHQIFYRQF
jgi:uncharacterized radical SAM protein YgiQ